MSPSPQQRRFVRLIVAAGLVGALMMSLAMTNTFSAFVASITNTNDTAATGSLILQETGATGTTACNSTDGGGVSTNTATCATFNKYGGNTAMLPSNAGGTTNNVTTLVNFKNTGTAAATAFTMAFGPCTQSAAAGAGTATDFCSKLHVKVTSGATTVQADTVASTLAGTTVTLPPALIPAANSGSTIPLTFTVYVDSTAGNTYQGLTASQPITWTLTG